MLDADDHGFRLAAFRHPLDGPFAATGKVLLASGIPDRPPVLVTGVSVGISYEPLRRLSPLLDLYELAVLDETAWPEVGDDDKRRLDPLEVTTAQEAEHTAQRLAGVISERGAEFAEQYASLDALLAEFSEGEEDHPHLTRAALLAAAGRLDEARQSLARLNVSERSQRTRSARRAARQLARWVHSGGDASLIPDAPPPSRFTARQSPSFSELWSDSQAERAALKQVREGARGTSREQARALLREALTRHGGRQQSPLWIESRLDHLWDSPEDRVQLGVTMLGGAARFGLGVAKAIRDREIPDLSAPDWLEPPDHALYEIARSDRWAAAELDPDARPWVDRVHDATPRLFGIAMLTAWLCRAGDGIDAPATLDVYVGEQRVGKVSAQDAVAYAGVMADAAARDEQPCLEAHLARRADGYLLELAKP